MSILSSTLTLPTNAPGSVNGQVRGEVVDRDGELWYEIHRADLMKPFLMTMASDSDHWLYLLSNGGLTAGRINPDNALLPYYTQDKMADMASTSGSAKMSSRS